MRNLIQLIGFLSLLQVGFSNGGHDDEHLEYGVDIVSLFAFLTFA